MTLACSSIPGGRKHLLLQLPGWIASRQTRSREPQCAGSIVTARIRRVITLLMLLPAAAIAAASFDIPADNASIRTSSAVSSEPATLPLVVYDAERNLLKVTAEGQTLGSILTMIEQQMDIEFIDQDSSAEKVSIQFDFLPLPAAIGRLLADRNYIVENKLDQSLARVWLLPVGEVADTPVSEDEFAVNAFYTALQGTKNAEQLAEEVKLLEQQLSEIDQRPQWLREQTPVETSLQGIEAVLNASYNPARQALQARELAEAFKPFEE